MPLQFDTLGEGDTSGAWMGSNGIYVQSSRGIPQANDIPGQVNGNYIGNSTTAYENIVTLTQPYWKMISKPPSGSPTPHSNIRGFTYPTLDPGNGMDSGLD